MTITTIAYIIGIVVGGVVGVTIFKSIFDAMVLASKINRLNREVQSVNKALDTYIEELKI